MSRELEAGTRPAGGRGPGFPGLPGGRPWARTTGSCRGGSWASGRSTYCIATERDPLTLASLRGFPPGHALAALLEIRAGDGLSVLRPQDRIDTVCLTGLGGRSVVRLLERGKPQDLGVRRLILQPQTEHGRVRRWLVTNGWGITAERMVRENGRFYVVVAAARAATVSEPSHPALGHEDLLAAGPCLASSTDPLVRAYWLAQDRRLSGILPGATGRGRDRTRSDRARVRRILAALPALPTDQVV